MCTEKILFVLITEGEEPIVRYAIIPYEKLEEYDLEGMNQQIVNKNCEDEEICGQIMDLYKRLGLEEMVKETDLQQYLHEENNAPFRVNGLYDIIVCGWSI